MKLFLLDVNREQRHEETPFAWRELATLGDFSCWWHGSHQEAKGADGFDGYGLLASQKGEIHRSCFTGQVWTYQSLSYTSLNGVRQPVGADLGIFTYFENKGTQGLIFFDCKHWSVYGCSQSPDLHNINYLEARTWCLILFGILFYCTTIRGSGLSIWTE